MTFNFATAKASALKSLKSPLLELLLLGPSGAGKSYCTGTTGLKTLFIYFTRETHGAKTAAVTGKDNIIPICVDFGTWGDEKEERAFTADETLATLGSLLTSYNLISTEGFKSVVLDGIAALEVVVKESTLWKKKCQSAKGVHNSFKETEASGEIIGSVINALKAVQRECGVHIIATSILDVKNMDGFGGITEAAPKLQGYGLCESVVANFGDILVVGRMTKGTDVKWKFQSLMDVKKVSKDENGTIKKILNFSPRISGMVLPPIMDADLSLIIKMKEQV